MKICLLSPDGMMDMQYDLTHSLIAISIQPP